MIFSLMGVFVKTMTNAGYSAAELVWFRASGQSLVAIIPFFYIMPCRKWLALRGICGGLGFLCYFESIKQLPLGDAITLFSLYPVTTTIVAVPFLGEPMTKVKVAAVFLSATGAVLIARPTFLFGAPADGEAKASVWGYSVALFGSLLGAFVMLLIRKVGKRASALHLMLAWAIGSLTISTALLLFQGSWTSPWSKDILFDLLAMVLFGSVAHFLMNYAGRIAPAGPGSVMRSSDVVWAYMWEMVVFKIQPKFSSFVGAGLVFGASALVGLSKNDPKTSETEGQATFSRLENPEEKQKRDDFEPSLTNDAIAYDDVAIELSGLREESMSRSILPEYPEDSRGSRDAHERPDGRLPEGDTSDSSLRHYNAADDPSLEDGGAGDIMPEGGKKPEAA